MGTIGSVRAGCILDGCVLLLLPDASCNHSGSNNDITVWQHMEFHKALDIESQLPMKYTSFIVHGLKYIKLLAFKLKFFLELAI